MDAGVYMAGGPIFWGVFGDTILGFGFVLRHDHLQDGCGVQGASTRTMFCTT